MSDYKSNFSTDENKMADFMKALAHPARVAIMTKLAQSNRCVEGEIIKDIPLSDSVVSLHLQALEKAGLIKGTSKTIRSCYCINWDAFWEFSDLFKMIFNDFQHKIEVQERRQNDKKKLVCLSLIMSFLQIFLETDAVLLLQL